MKEKNIKQLETELFDAIHKEYKDVNDINGEYRLLTAIIEILEKHKLLKMYS